MKASDVKKVDDLLKRVQKESYNTVSGPIQELMSYSKDCGSYILEKGLDKFLNLLSKKGLPGDVHPTIIMLLSQILKDKEDNAYLMLKQKNFLPIIMSLLGTSDHELMLMTQKLFIFDPMTIIEFIQKQISILTPLVESVCRGSNKEASRLLIMLAGAPTLSQLVLPIIVLNKHRFPITDLINLIISNAELRSMTSFSEFVSIVLHHPFINQLDFKDALGFYTDGWMNLLILKVLNHFSPIESDTEKDLLDFIHFIDSKPDQKFALEEPDIINFSKGLINPSIKVPTQEIQKSTFLFTRIYSLSFCDPEKVTEEAKSFIYSLILFEDEIRSSAAIQCIMYWVFHHKYTVPQEIVFKIASLYYSRISTSQRLILIKAALRSLANTIDTASTIQLFDEELKFNENDLTEILKTPPIWLFPHVKVILGDILNQEIYDPTLQIDAIGEIDRFFDLETAIQLTNQ